jgi:hypothetical protein
MKVSRAPIRSGVGTIPVESYDLVEVAIVKVELQFMVSIVYIIYMNIDVKDTEVI